MENVLDELCIFIQIVMGITATSLSTDRLFGNDNCLLCVGLYNLLYRYRLTGAVTPSAWGGADDDKKKSNDAKQCLTIK